MRSIVKDEERIDKIKNMVDKHYRSLLNDATKLAEIDGHSKWRQQEFKYLSTLIQKRIRYAQNPPDCRKAKKLVCNYQKREVRSKILLKYY